MAASNAAAGIEFCGRFFAGLASAGVEHVVVSPGSRSTPLALGAHAAGMELSVHIDERCGGFYGLGLATATWAPVALVCTSGTAAANYLPAVIEAAHSGVPLLVLTADRPPELRGFGAGQTIDQTRMFGSNPRWFFEAPVASEAEARMAGALAARALLEATGSPPGPVHINFPFREPLVDATGIPTLAASSPAIVVPSARGAASRQAVAAVAALVEREARGVIVAGPADHDDAAVAAIASLSRVAGWPILAEPASQLRTGPHVASGLTVATADVLLRSPEIADRLAPQVVFTVGQAATSKTVRQWLEQARPRHVVVTDAGRDVPDPSHLATLLTRASGAAMAGEVADAVGTLDRTPAWAHQWRSLDDAATAAIGSGFGTDPPAEPAAIRAIADSVPPGVSIYLANSMPVRDADMVWPATLEARRFFSQRGAAGIDGLTSAAAGAARGLGAPVVLVTGDLAFLHDLGGLTAAVREEAPLVVVVLDNGGGGIFSMLPVAEAIPPELFERVYTTPHHMDPGALASAAGAEVRRPPSIEQLQDELVRACTRARPTVLHLRLDIGAGFEQRERLVVAAHRAASAPG